MSSVVSLSAHLICNRIPGLTPQQRRICQQKPEALAVISNGVRVGLNECQRQFKNKRWNYTVMSGANLFGHLVMIGKLPLILFS